MLGTSLSLATIASLGDVDAQSFISRASLTDSTQISAVKTLVSSLKNTSSLWSAILALYPFVGGNAVAHAQNLKNDLYTISWSGAVTHNSNGITGNAVNQYGTCTGLTGNTVIPHLGGVTVYNRTQAATASGGIRRYCGFGDGGGSFYYTLDYASSVANRASWGGLGTSYISETAAQRTGTITANRSATNDFKCYNNGTQYLSTTTNDTSTPPSVDIMVLAFSSGGVVNAPCAENFSLFAVHSALTVQQVTDLATIIQTFQTTLGRNV